MSFSTRSPVKCSRCFRWHEKSFEEGNVSVDQIFVQNCIMGDKFNLIILAKPSRIRKSENQSNPQWN